MTNYQSTHFSTTLPNGWTSQTIADNSCLWQREEDTWILRIQCEDMGELEGDTLQATLVYIYTNITLDDGNVLLPVGDSIELPDGLLYEYRKDKEITRLDQQTFLANYGGMRLHIPTGRVLRFYCQFFFQDVAIPHLEGYMGEMLSIMQNIKFAAPIPAPQPAVSPLIQKLTNTRLHFMESYDSGFGGGGYNTEEIINLRSNRQFSYKYTHVTSAYSSGGFSLGGGYKDNKGAGTWQVMPGQDVLILSFDDGSEKQYDMRVEKGIIWLNNRKFFWERLDG